MKRLFTALKAKLRSRAGETLGETLVSLLVAALALVMLAGAITTSTRVIMRSKAKIDEYNATIEKVVKQGSDANQATVKIEGIEGNDLKIENVGIKYCQSSFFSNTPVIAYKIS